MTPQSDPAPFAPPQAPLFMPLQRLEAPERSVWSVLHGLMPWRRRPAD